MPKGPNGEKRPADAVGLAVLIGRIATGEVEDSKPHKKVSPVTERSLPAPSHLPDRKPG